MSFLRPIYILTCCFFAMTPTQGLAETKSEPAKTEEKEETSYFTVRKIAGYGVLAFLLVWMVWNQNRHEKKAKLAEDSEKNEPYDNSEKKDN